MKWQHCFSIISLYFLFTTSSLVEAENFPKTTPVSFAIQEKNPTNLKNGNLILLAEEGSESQSVDFLSGARNWNQFKDRLNMWEPSNACYRDCKSEAWTNGSYCLSYIPDQNSSNHRQCISGAADKAISCAQNCANQ